MGSRPPFLNRLERNGLYGSVVSIDHLGELVDEVKSLHDSGLMGDGVFKTYMTPFTDSKPPRKIPRPKSIIVVAFPHPMTRVRFHVGEKELRVIVPPTYFGGYKVTWRSREELKKAFMPRKYRLVRAVLPLKLLAVRSGLAKYGRNNITYVPRYGSFHRLTAFYSDYDSPADYWQEKEALPLCSKCKACLRACPTGAIQKDRFLIKADLCLTYLNEKPATEAFPTWVDSSAHNSIIGCMRCQRACPYDKAVLDWYDDRGSFSAKETEYLLRGKFEGSKARVMDEKLKRVGLDLTIFPRNLAALIEACEK